MKNEALRIKFILIIGLMLISSTNQSKLNQSNFYPYKLKEDNIFKLEAGQEIVDKLINFDFDNICLGEQGKNKEILKSGIQNNKLEVMMALKNYFLLDNNRLLGSLKDSLILQEVDLLKIHKELNKIKETGSEVIAESMNDHLQIMIDLNCELQSSNTDSIMIPNFLIFKTKEELYEPYLNPNNLNNNNINQKILNSEQVLKPKNGK